MNLYAIRAIYINELARTRRTLFQSIAAPVLSTSLYFVVFGSAIGGRIATIDGVAYARRNRDRASDRVAGFWATPILRARG